MDDNLDYYFDENRLIPWLYEYYQSHAGETVYLRNAIDEYVKEYVTISAVKIVENMLQDDIPLEVALDCAKIDKATFEKYSERTQ